ncbi:acetate--CoA ligase family protein [Microcella sp.]|uniref:acetate--CoA ligase family protein n=1 Tax=Microcella sp. TaxID=1913979 RepID=UPI00255E3366|nr:acetate--CoA ligase family protein [Microcella sp.]MBX9472382.1 acetate--CoA ligase family protein [Microcella sp.]
MTIPERPAQRQGLAALRSPSAVTIVGASPESFFADALLTNLTSGAFRFGKPIHLVSHSRTEVRGRPTARSLDLVDEPGMVYMAIPARHCVPVLESTRAPIEAVVVISSDFSPDEEEALRAWSTSTEVPVLGPNCMGLMSLEDGFFGYAGPLPSVSRGPVGLVMQSGGMLSGVVAALAARDIGVSTAVSYGNGAVLGYPDLVAGLLEDSRIETVLLYAESIADVRLLRVAGSDAASRGKNLVLVQGGQSEAGSSAAASHTGSLATPARIVEGVARQAGILACRDLEEAVWAIEALTTPGLPIPQPGGVAVLTTSGGGAVAMADAAQRGGLALETPSKATETAVPHAGNPHDLGAAVMNDAAAFADIVTSYATDSCYSVLVHVAGVGLPRAELPQHTAVARSFVDIAQGHGRAVVLSAIVGAPPIERWDGVVTATSAREGVAKARALAARFRRTSPALSPDHTDLQRGPVRLITGAESRAVLEGVRVEWPRSMDVETDIDALVMEIGLPLVLKAESLAHRAAAGGVIRDINSRAELDAALAFLHSRFPGAPVSAHEQIEHETELIVGFVRSREHGPLVSFGIGGTHVGDAVDFASAPLGPEDIHSLVASHVVGPSARAVQDLVADVADLSLRRPDIATLDLNPVCITADGEIYALDSKLEVVG